VEVTTLIAWVAADSRGPSSLNIATDSRITWPSGTRLPHWDHAQKVFASSTRPILLGYVGDVLYPALVLPRIIEQIDRGVIAKNTPIDTVVMTLLRRSWRDYPQAERRGGQIFLAFRSGDQMDAVFNVIGLHHPGGAGDSWVRTEIPVPPTSELLVATGSGGTTVKSAVTAWQQTQAANTSRAIFSGFVDAVVSGTDPASGGAPQLAMLYRVGNGRLAGIVHDKQRYFAGAHLIGEEELGCVEWRNSLFERTDGRTKRRLRGAQPQPRPPGL
jgi:hypothetical protein